MAVGKGSMERAAKAAAEKKTGAAAEKKTSARSSKKTVIADNAAAETEASVIAAPSNEVMEQIVYQKSSGMLERAAEPNERFGLGDAMPVYYF